MFCTFQNYLNTISFFCHGLNLSFLKQVIDAGRNAFFIDGLHGAGCNLKGNPLPCFGNEELLGLQVGIKTTLRFLV